MFPAFASPHRDHRSCLIVPRGGYGVILRLAADIHHIPSDPQDYVQCDHPVVEGGRIVWTGSGCCVDEVERKLKGGDREDCFVERTGEHQEERSFNPLERRVGIPRP